MNAERAPDFEGMAGRTYVVVAHHERLRLTDEVGSLAELAEKFEELGPHWRRHSAPMAVVGGALSLLAPSEWSAWKAIAPSE